MPPVSADGSIMIVVSASYMGVSIITLTIVNVITAAIIATTSR